MLKNISKNPRDELFKVVHPVLIEIFCEGILKSSSTRILSLSMLSLLTTPLGLFIVLLKKSLRVFIIGLTWLLLYLMLDDIGSTGVILMTLSFLLIFIDDIESEIKEALIHSIIIVSGGWFLKWICKGYLSSESEFCHDILYSTTFETIVAGLVPGLPKYHRAKYEAAFKLFNETRDPTAIELLKNKLDKLKNEA